MNNKDDITYLKFFINSYPRVFFSKHLDTDYTSVFSKNLDFWNGTFWPVIRHFQESELSISNAKLRDAVTMQTDTVWSMLVNGYIKIVQDKIFEGYFNKNNYHKDNLAYDLFEISLFARMYYICFYEKDEVLKQAKKQNIKEEIIDLFDKYGDLILKNLNSKCHDDFFTKEIVQYLQDDVYSCEMSMIFNDVKDVVSDKAVNEFLILSVAVSAYNTDSIKLFIRDAYRNNLFECYNYFAHPKAKNSIIKKIQRFVYRFKSDNKILDEDSAVKYCESCYDRLQNAIVQVYAEESYNQVIKQNQDFDGFIVAKETTQLLNLVVENKVKKIGLNTKLDSEHVNCISENEILLTSLTLPVYFIQAEELIKTINSYLDVLIINTIMRAAGSKAFNLVDENVDEIGMISFLSCIHEGQLILGANPMSYLRDYSKYGLLKSLIDGKDSFTSGREGFIAVIDKDRVNIKISNVQVSIIQLSEDEIAKQIITENDKCYVNVANDINLQFSRSQAEEYLRKEKRRVNIYCDVEIRYCDDKVGDYILMNEEE